MRNAAVRAICLAGVATIVAAILFGPLLAPPEFSWLSHTTSQQAAQQMQGAWAMQVGFGVFGASVVACSVLDRTRLPLVRAALTIFGMGMIASAIWSNAPILPGALNDATEDHFHSIASWVVGIAFIAACVARLFAPGGSSTDPLAWIGLAVGLTFPGLMAIAPDVSGLLQRIMFGVSFFFVVQEFAIHQPRMKQCETPWRLLCRLIHRQQWK